MDWSTSYYYILRRIARTYRNDSLSLRDTAPDERNNLSISETGLPCRLPFWSFFILYTQANVVSILSPYLAFSPRRAKTRGQRQPTSNEGGNTRTRRYLEKAQIRQLALPVEGMAALSHPAMLVCGAPHIMQRMKQKFVGRRRVSVGVDLGTPAVPRKNYSRTMKFSD